MGKITENEKRQLAKIIEDKGFYTIKSTASFNRYIDNVIDGYRNNDLYTYICGGHFDERIVKEILLSSYSVAADSAIAYADSPALNACAVWIPSGIVRANLHNFIKNGGTNLIKYGGPELILRVIKYVKLISDMKKVHTRHNDWYLFNYECKPEADSEELFINLIKPVVDYAWTTGRSCYAEATLESRISGYLKMGFHFVDKAKISKTDITMYSMMV